MKLRVKTDRLILKKENKTLTKDTEFEVSDIRGLEILNTLFDGKPVVECIDTQVHTDEELEAKVKELEETNTNLVAEKEELEAKVKELEETNTNLVAEKEELEKNIIPVEGNETNENKKGKSDK